MQKGRQHGAVDARINPRAIRSSEGTVIFPGVPGESADVKPSTSSPSKPFHGSGKVKAAVDGSEAKACLHCMQGGDPSGGYSRPHGPVRKPIEEGDP